MARGASGPPLQSPHAALAQAGSGFGAAPGQQPTYGAGPPPPHVPLAHAGSGLGQVPAPQPPYSAGQVAPRLAGPARAGSGAGAHLAGPERWIGARANAGRRPW